MVAECHGGGAAAGGDFIIKLFGKTIPVPECGGAKDLQQSKSSSWTEQDQDSHGLENAPAPAPAHTDTSDSSPQPEVVDAEDPTETQQRPGDGDGDGDAAGQREKLKKPDKVLPCPRCNSMDTKFCYFNNYNVNQPRHFCKNCQRYWTAGGAMRNVPVGAGRRKNKNAVAAASHFFQRVRATNATVLSFGGHGGAPPAGPAACLDLDLAEQLSHQLAPVRSAGDAGRPCSEGSTSRDDTGGRSSVDEAAANADDASLQQHPATASMNNSGATVWPPYSCAPAPAAYFPSGIAIPIYPAAPAYWGCMVPGAWSLPWPVQPASSASPTTTSAPSVVSSSGAADDSHTLGKRPRDRREGDDGRNGCNAHGGSAKVWAPKSIRIDDVDEVARSSIWSLVGIKGDKTKQQDAADRAGGHSKQLGTVFEPKRGETTKKAMMTSSSPLLHANPVALTRSVAFQEGS